MFFPSLVETLAVAAEPLPSSGGRAARVLRSEATLRPIHGCSPPGDRVDKTEDTTPVTSGDACAGLHGVDVRVRATFTTGEGGRERVSLLDARAVTLRTRQKSIQVESGRALVTAFPRGVSLATVAADVHSVLNPEP